MDTRFIAEKIIRDERRASQTNWYLSAQVQLETTVTKGLWHPPFNTFIDKVDKNKKLEKDYMTVLA